MLSRTFPSMLLAGAILLAACGRHDTAGSSNVHQSDTSEVQLVSEVSAITPGHEFTLGLRFQTAEGWHIYWRNPGDAGAAPQIEWQAPDGFTFGPIQWPAPTRYASGDFADYGYDGDVMLLVNVQAPPTVTPDDTITITASAEWLICRETCIPEFADFTLDLPVSEAPAEDTRWTGLFEANRHRLPVAHEGMSATAVSTEGATIVLTIVAPEDLNLEDKDLHFFANQQGLVEPGADQEYAFSGDAIQVTLRKSTFLSDLPDNLEGVLVSKTTGNGRANTPSFKISASWTDTAP